jgi:hypothetical protein
MGKDRNMVELSGRLVRDIWLRETRDGNVYGMITVVVRGKTEKKVDFFEIFVWNKRIIEHFGKYLKAGKKVVVRGELSKSEKGVFINVFEDYGVMICVDIRELKAKAGEEWVRELEEENKVYEEKLKKYQEELPEEAGIKKELEEEREVGSME